MRLLGSRRVLLSSANKSVASLNFVAQSYSLNGKQYPLGVLPGWSYARTGATYAQDASGNLQYFLPNQPPITSNGLDVWQSGTNISTLSTNQFSSSSFSRTGLSNLDSQATAPDGSLTASTITTTAGAGNHYIYQSAGFTATAAAYTDSLYVKANGGRWIALSFGANATSDGAFFDLQNGVVGTVASSTTAGISSLANGWYRIWITRTLSATTKYLQVEPHSADNQSASWTAAGTENFYIWQQQPELGSFPTSPMLTGRNLLVQSQTLGTTWSSTGGSWSTSGSSPVGSSTAQVFTENTSNTAHDALQSYTVASGATVTTQWRATAGTRRYIQLGNQSVGGTNAFYVTVDTSNWTITEHPVTGTGVYTSSSITPDPALGGWYIITVTGSIPSTTTYYTGIGGTTSATGGGFLPTYTGTSSTIIGVAAQTETGSVANSYDPTTTASLPRGAAAISETYGPPNGSAATVNYGTSSTASPSPSSPINLGSTSGGAWVNNHIRSLVVAK